MQYEQTRVICLINSYYDWYDHWYYHYDLMYFLVEGILLFHLIYHFDCFRYLVHVSLHAVCNVEVLFG